MAILDAQGQPVRAPAPVLEEAKPVEAPSPLHKLFPTRQERKSYLRYVAKYNINRRYPNLSNKVRKLMAARLAKAPDFIKAVEATALEAANEEARRARMQPAGGSGQVEAVDKGD